jgi:hypothetical protein
MRQPCVGAHLEDVVPSTNWDREMLYATTKGYIEYSIYKSSVKSYMPSVFFVLFNKVVLRYSNPS